MRILMKHPMRTYCAVILMLSLLLGGCGTEQIPSSPAQTQSQPPKGPETVASAMDLAESFRAPQAALPDLHFWSSETVGYQEEPHVSQDGTTAYYTYKTDLDTIRAYVEMLKNSGFTQVGIYEGYKGSMYYWAFTCDAAEDVPMIYDGITETDCHVYIGWTDSSRKKFRFGVARQLPVCDTGLRQDGSTVDVMPQGISAGAALLRNSDGSYATADGRLQTTVGNAMVIRDGTVYNTTGSYHLDGSKEKVWIDDYYRNESIYIQFNTHALMQGDVYRNTDIRDWNLTAMDKGSVDHYQYDAPLSLFIFQDGKMRQPTWNDSYYETATLRLMYYDRGGDAVFYIYARFDNGQEPKEVEALVAVSMAQSGVLDDATYMKVGDRLTLTYSHREFDSDYHTFDWEIIEGVGKAAIDVQGDTCSVTAQSPGVVRVRVTYHYTADEPDVLTGIIRPVRHAITETYSFIIE